MKKYAGVIVRKEDKCLFCKRNADMSKFAGEWSIPGGSVEKGEGIPQAAQREFYEETNVELDTPIYFLGVMSSISVTNYARIRPRMIKNHDYTSNSNPRHSQRN